MLPAASPCGKKNALVVLDQNVKTGKGVAYAECQIKDYLMKAKIFVIVANARDHREVCGWFAPSGVSRVERFSVIYDLRWDVGTGSRPEPDLNAAIARSRHDVVSATIGVKTWAKGRAPTIGEGDATPLVHVESTIAVVADVSSGGSFLFTKILSGSRTYEWQDDPPSLGPARPNGGHCAPRRSVQSYTILRGQIVTCVGGGTRMSDSAARTRELAERMPSMMSTSPPAGHRPTSLRVQKAGQVAQPVGMCVRSRMITASSYAFCE